MKNRKIIIVIMFIFCFMVCLPNGLADGLISLALKDPEVKVAKNAAFSLRYRSAPEDSPARLIETLEAALRHSDTEIKRMAAESLRDHSSTLMISLVEIALRDKDSSVRANGINALKGDNSEIGYILTLRGEMHTLEK